MHVGTRTHIRDAPVAGGVPQVFKTWLRHIPQAEIDREIATHTVAEAAGVAPAIGVVGLTQGSMYMTMQRLGRSIAEFAATEASEAVDAALSEIKGLYSKLDGAAVIHNSGDPRNARLDEAAGRWCE